MDNGTENQGYLPHGSDSCKPSGEEANTTKNVNKGEHKVQEKTQPRRQFKRTIIIEPSFALFFMFHISSFSLVNQFIYFAIGEKYNLSELIRAAGSNGSGSSGLCGTEGNTNNSLYILQQEVQAEASRFQLYLDLVTGLPAVLACMFYGTVVDRLGRKPGLIIPLIGVMVKGLTYLSVQLIPLPLEVLFFAHIVEALTGGFGAFMTACYAFYADTVTPDNMGRRLAISDVAFGFTLAVMDVLLGFVITNTGFVWPFVIVLSGHVLNVTYVIFFIPETVDKSQPKKPVSPKFIIESFKVLTRKRPNKGRFLLLFFVLTWTICRFGTFNRYGLLHLYKLNSPFCWSAALIGLYGGIQNVISNTVQVIVAIVLMKRIGEVNVVQLSCASFIVAFVLEALSTTDWMLFMVPFVGCFMGLQVPVMRAVLSGLVPNEEQGAIFSVVSASDNIMTMMGSSFFNPIYAATLYSFKGAVFVIMAGFVLISMICLWIFARMQKKAVKLQEREVDTCSVHSLEIWSVKL